jgi:hypothetical protein
VERRRGGDPNPLTEPSGSWLEPVSTEVVLGRSDSKRRLTGLQNRNGMRFLAQNTSKLAGLVVLVLLLAGTPLVAQDWQDSFSVWVTYEELTGQDSGFGQIVFTLNIPMGTPLLAREAVINSALRALKEIWDVQSVHEEIRGFLGPEIPDDIREAVSQVNGTSLILAITDAFNTVEDAGYSRFQGDVSISTTEKIALPLAPRTSMLRTQYPDAPRYYEWIVGGGSLGEEANSETWIIASLVNFSAAILSFRSEFGRFPTSLAELNERGHLLISPINPYTNLPVQQVNHAVPGDITYQYVDQDKVELNTYILVNDQIDVVNREINLNSSVGSFDLLYRETTGLTENEKKVARYIFQISQILNEYYYKSGDLPYSIPQCESEGFAYVSFTNPYMGRDAAQAMSLAAIQPGDYRYNRVSGSEYFLAGYGEGGRQILTVGKNFAIAELPAGQLRLQ